MKRIFAILMTLALCCSAAIAEGCVASSNGTIYGNLSGLVRLEDMQQITTNPIHSMQTYEGSIYFVEVTPLGEVIRAIQPDGSIREVAGPQLAGEEPGYDKQGNLISLNRNYGYSEMIVYDGYIYYIGTEQTDGSYTAIDAANNASYAVNYTLGAAVYRMPVHGGYGVKMISGLGNGNVQLAIANDRIAVSSAFVNPIYAYNFTNFMLYDMDGILIKTFENNASDAQAWYSMQDAEFTVIVNELHTDGENIFASLGDSEGDFATSRLVDVRNIEETLAYEAFYTPAVITDDGIVNLATDVKEVFYEEGMENSAHIERIVNGESHRIAGVPAEFVNAHKMQLSVLNGTAYLSNGIEIMEFPLELPAQDNAGIATLEIVDDELLPESDDRLIEKSELEGYDKDTLALMRNEILARYGYPFKKEIYRSYFGSKRWYIENPNFEYGMLSSIEMKNVETIKALEAAK